MGTVADYTYGVWIMEDEGAWLAANTPDTCTYTNLVEGDSYIYLDNIVKFDVKMYSNREGEDFLGWKTIQIASSGKVSASTGGGLRCFVTVTAIVTEDIGEKLKTLYDKHVVAQDGNKYLAHQRAATTFEQFPNEAGTLKKYIEIIIRSMDFTETNDKGKDVKLCVILCEQVGERY